MAPTTREEALNLLVNVGGLSEEEKVALFDLLAGEDDDLVVRLFSTPIAFLEKTLRRYLERKRSTGSEVIEVMAKTDDVPSKTLKVPARKDMESLAYSLNVDSIEKGLAARGQVLLGINGGYPACENGWSSNLYDCSNTVELQVAPKPVDRATLREQIIKWAGYVLTAVIAAIWAIAYFVSGRSPGNPPSG